MADTGDRMRIVIGYALWATLCAAVAGAALSLVNTWFFSYHAGRAGFWSTLLEDFATTLVIEPGRERRGVPELQRHLVLPLRFARPDVRDDAAVGIGAVAYADRQHVAGDAEVLHRARQGERVGGHDAHAAGELDERFRIEALGIDHRRERVGEDLELGRHPHVVAVGGDAVRNDAGARLVFGERLDHGVFGRHAPNPAVGLDGHGPPIYRWHRHLRHSIRLTTLARANTFRRGK